MIQIEQPAFKVLLDDSVNSYPDECCGFMFGSEAREIRNISIATPVINSKQGDKRRRFEISAKDYMNAERYAEENGLSLLGIYHSHPEHPAIPSEQDRLSAQPFFSYVIISIVDQKFVALTSWRLNDERQFEEEKIFEYQYI
jgi:proteasome lid subunit RPN8/RPN11